MKAFLSVRKAMSLMMCALAATCLTSCEDDDDSDEIAEIFSLDSVTAVANSDGTIDITGSVTTNKKLKTFTLTSSAGTVYDLLENSDAAEKNKDEDTNEKSWTVTLTGTTIPVDIYTLEVRTRMNTKKTSTIGASYSFTVGTGSNATVGSYVSLVNQSSYLMSAFYDSSTRTITNDSIVSNIEVILDSDASSIKSASKAASSVIAAAAAEAAIYPSSNTVITSTGCIATYAITNVDTDNGTAVLSGVVMNSEGIITIDTSDADYAGHTGETTSSSN